MKATAESTFGNYKWFGEADITDEQAQILVNLGFLWVMQRSPSSNAEKVLAGYEKRPSGFERKSIPFSESDAKRLATLLGAKVEIEKDIKITPVITSVVFHEIGKGTEPKYVEEKSIIARHVKEGDFLDWIKDTVEYAGDADYKSANDTKVLAAVKAYKQRRLMEV
jgi:hypothetical protein